nr:cation transporter [Serinibacter salmoneus]
MSRPTAPDLTATRRDTLTRRVRWIVVATITYNVIEAVVALVAGAAASSSALIAFGLDSVVEVLSAAAVAWQFSARTHALREQRERHAMRLIGVSFIGLAAMVTIDSLRSLFGGEEAQHSGVGIALAAVSLAIMPALSWFERRTGRELGSASAVADSKQTLLCTYLSAVLLVGLLLNSAVGWSWADPIAALVIAGIAVREGVQAWRGDGCCSPAELLADPGHTATGAHGCCESTPADAAAEPPADDDCCTPANPTAAGLREGRGDAPTEERQAPAEASAHDGAETGAETGAGAGERLAVIRGRGSCACCASTPDRRS